MSLPEGLRDISYDFAGGTLEGLGPDAAVAVRVDMASGSIDDVGVRWLPGGEGWRATFLLEPQGQQPADLRLVLTLDGSPVTKT